MVLSDKESFNAFAEEKLFRPYDCARLLFEVFSDETGMSAAVCESLGVQLRTGMGCKETCGALTAALVIRGLLGCKDNPSSLVEKFRAANQSCSCSDIMAVGGRESCMHAVKTAYGLIGETTEF